MKQNRWSFIILPMILLIITCLVYYATLWYGFRFDDNPNIVKDFAIRSRTFASTFFTSTRWISLWVNAVLYHYYDLNPWSYRLFDLIVHCLNGLLLYMLILFGCLKLQKNTFARTWALVIATTTAGLFLLHPVQTQTVCYVIQGQLEGLALLGILGTSLTFFFTAYTQNNSAKILGSIITCVFAFLTTGTKEIAIITPAILCTITWFFIAEGSWQRFKKELPLLGLITLIMGASYVILLKPAFVLKLLQLQITETSNRGNVISDAPYELITPGAFALTQIGVLLHYLIIFFWPFGLSVDYDWKLVEKFNCAEVLIPLIIIIFLIWHIILRRFFSNPRDLLVCGALWFVIAIFPRASLIPSREIVADYKTYVASPGIVFVITILLLKGAILLCRCKKPQKIAAMTLCILLPLGLLARWRTRVWATHKSFWGDILLKAPKKARAYNNYALALLSEENFQGALELFDKAIELDDHYPEPWNNRAVALIQLNKNDEAITSLRRAISLHSDNPEACYNLATLLIKEKNYNSAEYYLKRATALRPSYGKAWYLLASLYYEKKNFPIAEEYFKRAIEEADFEKVPALLALTDIAVQQKKFTEACELLHKATELEPQSVDIKTQLAHINLLQGNYEITKKITEEILVSHENNLHALFCLAEAYSGLNQDEEALQTYKKLLPRIQEIPLALLRMAGCATKLNLRTEALGHLTMFLALNPPSPLKEHAQALLKQLRQNHQETFFDFENFSKKM